jgi:hypothetical protein
MHTNEKLIRVHSCLFMDNQPMPEAKSEQSLQETFDKAASSPIVRVFARVGYATRGTIYFLIGILAALGAVGAGKGVRGSQGAFEAVLAAPFGKLVLFFAGIGFSGFTIYFLISALRTPSRRESLAIRSGWLFSGLIYLGLVVSAIRLLIRGGRENATRESSQWLMSHPLGRWILACIGLGIIGFALFELWRGLFSSLAERLRFRNLDQRMRDLLSAIGRVGIVARGLIFLIIGIFLVLAAWFNDAREARTLGGVLRFVEREPYGPWLLAIVAFGLIAFGLFQFVEARYRRMD